jgi:hypothetical protein
MELQRHIDALLADLADIAAVGDDAVAEAADRLSSALRSAANLRLFDALSEAALEISGQLPSGHVDVRLAGQEASLVFVGEEEPDFAAGFPGGSWTGDEATPARISLRLPEALKASIEEAAAKEGMSVNAWLVRALARAVSGHGQVTATISSRGPGKRLTGYARS